MRSTSKRPEPAGAVQPRKKRARQVWRRGPIVTSPSPDSDPESDTSALTEPGDADIDMDIFSNAVATVAHAHAEAEHAAMSSEPTPLTITLRSRSAVAEQNPHLITSAVPPSSAPVTLPLVEAPAQVALSATSLPATASPAPAAQLATAYGHLNSDTDSTVAASAAAPPAPITPLAAVNILSTTSSPAPAPAAGTGSVPTIPTPRAGTDDAGPGGRQCPEDLRSTAQRDITVCRSKWDHASTVAPAHAHPPVVADPQPPLQTMVPAAVTTLVHPADVQQAIDRATAAGLTNPRVTYTTVEQIDRFIAIHGFTDMARNNYPLRMLPHDAEWGFPTAFSDFSSTLCARGTSRAILLNVVGEISRLSLAGPVGQAIPRATVHVLPLDPAIRAAAEQQITAMSNPPDHGEHSVLYLTPLSCFMQLK
ncbi:hypothetical protein C8R44DRAFT_878193 [Mycena epipterygia]|nr:hypothetical protein C8R44DRAFT_878193 [Mycena epipterygia]